MDQRRLRRGATESDLSFARRTFLVLRQYLTYELPAPGARVSASIVCKSAKGDCGGQSALFIAILRANRVPARTVGGGIIPDAKGPKVELLGHVRSEFFARGIGWIPVDMTFHNGTPFGLFGDIPANMMMDALDTDLLVEPFAGQPATLSWLGGFAWWWSGAGGPEHRVKRSRWSAEVTEFPAEPVATVVIPFSPYVYQPPKPLTPPPVSVNVPTTPPEISSPVKESAPEKDGSSATLALIVFTSIFAAGVLLLALNGWLSRRRPPPLAALAPPAPTYRCGRCGVLVRLVSGQPGMSYRCPGCGTICRL
jgi:hypothetical protein